MVFRGAVCGFGLLFVAACGGGGGAETSEPKSPVVEVAAVSTTQPKPGEIAGPDEDEPRAEGKRSMSAEACIEELRTGKGLPESARRGPDAEAYAESLAEERAGRMDQARKGYLGVIQKYPMSLYVPLTYFAFGEGFRAEADKDPTRMQLAKQSYMEVIKYPPPANTAYLAAHYRLASIHWRSGEGPAALSELRKVLEAATQKPEMACAESLAAPARENMVAVYAEAGRASAAYNFFRSFVSTAHALGMLADLAEIYAQRGQVDDAAQTLLAAGSDQPATTEFCVKEAALVEELGKKLKGRKGAELAETHQRRCTKS